MNDQAPDLEYAPKQRSVVITDQAWSALQGRVVFERKSASELCEFLMSHYIDLETKPPRYELSDQQAEMKRKRSVYVADPIWAASRAQAVLEHRSVSAILEQLIRGYVGLDLGNQFGRSGSAEE